MGGVACRLQNMADEVEERCPNAIVVRLGVLRDYVRWNRSDKVVRSWYGAVKQEQPCSLKVGNLLEPVPKARLNLLSVPKEALHELWAAYRRTKDNHSVSFRVEVTFPNGIRRPRSTVEQVIDPLRFRPSAFAPDLELA